MILVDGKQSQIYFGDGDVQVRGVHIPREEFMYIGFCNSTPNAQNTNGSCDIDRAKFHKEMIFESGFAVLAFSKQEQVDSLIEQLNHLKTNLPE